MSSSFVADRILCNTSITSNVQPNYISSGGWYLVMQEDSNLVLYCGNVFTPNNAVWSSGTNGKGHGVARCTMQADGNLVVYDGNSKPLWASNTNNVGRGPHIAYLNPTGILEVVDSQGAVIFKSQQVPPQKQPQPQVPQTTTTTYYPNVIVTTGPAYPAATPYPSAYPAATPYPSAASPYPGPSSHHLLHPHHHRGKSYFPGHELSCGAGLHSSNVSAVNHGQFNLVMQEDGNLVVYQGQSWEPRHSIWATGTDNKGQGPFRLTMQHDGNLVLYDINSKPTWASGTDNKGQQPLKLHFTNHGALQLIDRHNTLIWTNKNI
ncbi:hypothetical protein DFA_09428 [Cavenderia fasciculata]|uniref:Bulb-type lectin domain-containing protein n=1 Tax=Cavenderia fasciculata TaxID=261658 RepID=F4Q7L2_CACFS|nr:uncharacterized protein DFA_09428 [Cavenderia fasciculata]EGG16394.1 hypothetical protein DFA_09428 [Cavenderia fasciculata]|eukprot:XP_004354778.1 hypothetical protein DFA_09428 [Cavenderia fasciculata]